MLNSFFKLVGHEPVQCQNIQEYIEWYMAAEIEGRRVAFTDIEKMRCIVSTVFLGTAIIDFNDNSYLHFETMIIGGDLDGYTRRAKTWDEAVANHEEAINELFKI